jgi:trans-aconitate methyltransferase
MDEYKGIRKKIETPAFFRKKVIRNYLFRGPVLEWYMKVKIRMEDNYVSLHNILPESGIISDIGCGYGFMSYMLQLMAPERKMFAYDYDIDKIETARNVALNNKNFQFEQADARTLEPEQSDAFILADVLHYMPEKDQDALIRKCAGKLNNDGIIIIRDADVSMKKKHTGTRLSEWFSTRLGFNRTITDDKRLYFSSKENYLAIFAELDLDVSIIDNTKRTSNLVYVLRKKK